MSRLAPPAFAGLALAALVLTAGCGAFGGGSSPSSSAPASPEPATSSSATPAPAQPTPADPRADTGNAQLGQVVASRTSAVQEKKVTIQLYPVVREGAVSHLNFVLSSPVTDAEHLQVAGLLTDDNYSAIDSTGFAVDGVTLIDGKNAKLYLVASDGKGTCLCSRGLASTFLEEDVPQLFSATFAAPPADVTTVDVRVPHFGTVKDVPVQ